MAERHYQTPAERRFLEEQEKLLEENPTLLITPWLPEADKEESKNEEDKGRQTPSGGNAKSR